MKPDPPPALRTASPWTVLALALLASAVAVWSGMGLLTALPTTQLLGLTSQQTNAQVEAIIRGGGPVSHSAALAILGRQFTAAMHDDAAMTTLRGQLAGYSSATGGAALGRLIQAAVVLRELERGRAPPETWWLAVEPYLEGLDRADFAHGAAAYRRALAEGYVRAGRPAYVAWDLANAQVGNAFHAPLVFLVTRLEVLAAARQAAGDAAGAQLCTRIVRRVLRQFVLEPGPIGTRLAAADLLADELDGSAAGRARAALRSTKAASQAASQPTGASLADAAGDAPAAAPGESELQRAAALREWRENYRAAVLGRPMSQFTFAARPALDWAAHDRALGASLLASWLAAAGVAAALLAILLAWFWIRARTEGPHWGPLLGAALLSAGSCVVAGLVWQAVTGAALPEDLRRDVPLHPFYGGVSALVAIVLFGAFWGRRAKSKLTTRCGALAAATWLLLAGGATAAALAGRFALATYMERSAAALADEYAALAGDDLATLQPLRDWNP
jgi:hypothetical protein